MRRRKKRVSQEFADAFATAGWRNFIGTRKEPKLKVLSGMNKG